jgi:hypothetical protein
MRWTPVPGSYRGASRVRVIQPKDPAGSYPAIQIDPSSRTKTDPMLQSFDLLSRTQTESMPSLPPEQEPPRAGAPLAKLALPSRLLEPNGPSRRKAP